MSGRGRSVLYIRSRPLRRSWPVSPSQVSPRHFCLTRDGCELGRGSWVRASSKAQPTAAPCFVPRKACRLTLTHVPPATPTLLLVVVAVVMMG
ncbi:hypothetical protein E2C01_064921 [Portunus trituberculatus]|uniref:Uncharacterized protein n=1 Tax=Portunus trituberculatus TaxID=210409 RepID=A0A5B7HL54_PORTR|nr:hypothetical protein [Portunus trituberculatus]